MNPTDDERRGEGGEAQKPTGIAASRDDRHGGSKAWVPVRTAFHRGDGVKLINALPIPSPIKSPVRSSHSTHFSVEIGAAAKENGACVS